MNIKYQKAKIKTKECVPKELINFDILFLIFYFER